MQGLSMAPKELPLDILPLVLAQLSDPRDWHACALVSSVFNRAATPLLYRTLDSRIYSKSVIHHPSATLLKRPELATYVRNVTETGAIHRALHRSTSTEDTLRALSLCKNLESMTWIDDSSTMDTILLSLLSVVRHHPLREIYIRTHSDLGNSIWSELINLRGLCKISIWCMEGPPRVLQGWSEFLGETLTHLELGVSAYSYPCWELLSQLPNLKDLRLKGAPATAIPTILTYLLDLRSLDTEYQSYAPSSRLSRDPSSRFPTLRQLTVRTSSMDSFGVPKLWRWIHELIPLPGLETFKLSAFTVNVAHMNVPRMFILDLARVHRDTLKHFIVGDVQLTLGDVECLCSMFPGLETIVCSVASPDMESIVAAIAPAKKLRILRLHVQWLPGDLSTDGKSPGLRRCLTMQNAMDLMLRSEDSQLRAITVGSIQYTGKWVLDESQGGLKFQVVSDVAEERWQT